MSTLDVVADVLREVAPRALSARGIVKLAAGRLPTESRTPETVVSRDLALDVKRNGASSRFLRTAPGEFLLKEALPTAFYNEIEPYPAAWIRNLVTAGQIANGVVDERSIRDLKPADVASYRQCHFFAGIGIWSRALRDAEWPDDFNVWSGSCPCQGMSSAGRRLGFADERHLWPEWFRLIKECRPAVIFTEQVASKDGRAWLSLVHANLAAEDYVLQSYDLPACGFGAPHRRQRLYAVAYARERGREILGAPWLYAQGQPGYNAARRSTLDGRAAIVVSDATGSRCAAAEDTGTGSRDADACTEAIERGPAGDLESERSCSPDGTGTVSDAERVVWHAGWTPLAHGRAEIESDGYGEADGTSDNGTIGMGDAGLARGGRDTGTVLGAKGACEGERIEAGDLADESGASGSDDGTTNVAGHGFADVGFRPGDRIRIDGDPSWGGAVRGFWVEDVEWIYCRPEPGHENGRWRPAQSSIEPLAHGNSSGMGRTRAKRLKALGNAICLPQASAFVGAVIEALADATLEEARQLENGNKPRTNVQAADTSPNNAVDV